MVALSVSRMYHQAWNGSFDTAFSAHDAPVKEAAVARRALFFLVSSFFVRREFVHLCTLSFV